MYISTASSRFIFETIGSGLFIRLPSIGEAHIYLERGGIRRWWAMCHEGGGIEFRFGWLHVVAGR